MSSLFPPPQQNQLAQAIQNALALHQRGQLAEAEKAYRRILKSWPDQFDALHLYGMLHFQRGQHAEALRLINQALRIDPSCADAHSNLGMVLATLKRPDDAMKSFERALALEPNNLGALNNRGRALVEAGRAQDALAQFDKVLALQPGHLEARINRANACLQLSRHDEAIAAYDAVIAAYPAHPGAHVNRGNALFAAGRLAEALETYDRALALRADYAQAWNARGVVLQALRRNEDAVASFERAVMLNRDYADAHFNMSLSLLTLGDYPRGFTEYEWRWKRTGMPAPRDLRKPLWTGEKSLQGKTILLHAEQGLGDTIQFARYVPLLAKTGARVMLETQPELRALLSGLDGLAAIGIRGESLPDFDFHCPLGSLPHALNTEFATVPADIPYLRAPQDKVAAWRERLASLPGPRVVLAWAGSAAHANDRNRSIPLDGLLPLLSTGAHFVSLQRELRSGDADILASEPRILHLGAEIGDFADTAAIIAACDLVVSVDTSVAHVAGATGAPLVVLIPFAPDWRWTLDRSASPWYPQAELLRQTGPGDWSQVVARLADRIASLA